MSLIQMKKENVIAASKILFNAKLNAQQLIDLNTNTKVVLWVAKDHVSAGPVPEEALLN